MTFSPEFLSRIVSEVSKLCSIDLNRLTATLHPILAEYEIHPVLMSTDQLDLADKIAIYAQITDQRKRDQHKRYLVQ